MHLLCSAADCACGVVLAADWERWDQAKLNLYVLSVAVGGVLLVRYWLRREKDHFLHHRHQQEPYAFFIKRDDVVGAGFWPGRACQFLEFNCPSTRAHARTHCTCTTPHTPYTSQHR